MDVQIHVKFLKLNGANQQGGAGGDTQAGLIIRGRGTHCAAVVGAYHGDDDLVANPEWGRNSHFFYVGPGA